MSPPIRTDQLRAVIALADSKVTSKAAADLGMTTASLRKMVHAFELQLGVPLFDWRRNRVQPTEQGEVFLAKAQYVLDVLQQAVQRADGRPELLAQLTVPNDRGGETGPTPRPRKDIH